MSDVHGSNDDPATGNTGADPDRAPRTGGDDLFAAYEAALARTRPSGTAPADDTAAEAAATDSTETRRSGGSALSDAIGEDDLGDDRPWRATIGGGDDREAPAGDHGHTAAQHGGSTASDDERPSRAPGSLWAAAAGDERADGAAADGASAPATETPGAPLYDATVAEEQASTAPDGRRDDAVFGGAAGAAAAGAADDRDARHEDALSRRGDGAQDGAQDHDSAQYRDGATHDGAQYRDGDTTEDGARYRDGEGDSAQYRAETDRRDAAHDRHDADDRRRDTHADSAAGGAYAAPYDDTDRADGTATHRDGAHDTASSSVDGGGGEPGHAEPDYAALAAELEEFERRNAGGATDGEARRDDPWFGTAQGDTFTASEPRATGEAEVAPSVTASEPAFVPAPAPAPEPAPEPAPSPVFVQVPEPPRMRGNRGAAGLIGLLAAVVFAVLYFAATLGWRLLTGVAEITTIGADALDLVLSFEMWVPVAVFWLGFWLLGALINRARWGTWVTLGFFVGVIAYGGHLLGQLFQAQFWMITASEGADILRENLLSPVAIAAFVFGREITIWFSAWVARRGAKVTVANADAQAEYDRTLEAGPQLQE